MSGTLQPSIVNSSIPLAAGQGAAQQPNPLDNIEKFALTQNLLNENALFPGRQQLQQQAVTGGAASLAQHLNQVGASAMTPALSIPNLTMAQLTHIAGGAEGIAGGTTQGLLGQVASLPYAPDTPEWSTAVKQLIASQAQVSPEAAVAQEAGVPGQIQTAAGIRSGTYAPAVAGGGFTEATSTPMGVAPVRGVRLAGPNEPGLAPNQPVQTVLPAISGGPTVPARPGAPTTPGLGSGTYPTRPLTQLGPAYVPPGGAAPGAPNRPPPSVAPPGSVVMRGPRGAFMVPPDKVQAFRAAGYQ